MDLGIGHRDGSALVSIMLGENLIEKTRFKGTFILERKNGDSKKSESSPLLSKEGFLHALVAKENVIRRGAIL